MAAPAHKEGRTGLQLPHLGGSERGRRDHRGLNPLLHFAVLAGTAGITAYILQVGVIDGLVYHHSAWLDPFWAPSVISK